MPDYSSQSANADSLRNALQILAAWGVSYDDQPAYLGMPGNLSRRDYNKLRLGSRRPENPEVYARARLIQQIHQATLTIFPFSEPSANLWVQIPQRPFGGKSALDIIRVHGLEGMNQVSLAVDNQFPAFGTLEAC